MMKHALTGLYIWLCDYLVKSDVCIYDNVNITLISFLQISDINPTFMFIPCKMCSEVKFVYQHMVECNFWTLSKHLNEAHNIIVDRIVIHYRCVKRLEWISKAISKAIADIYQYTSLATFLTAKYIERTFVSYILFLWYSLLYHILKEFHLWFCRDGLRKSFMIFDITCQPRFLFLSFARKC